VKKKQIDPEKRREEFRELIRVEKERQDRLRDIRWRELEEDLNEEKEEDKMVSGNQASNR